MTSEPYTMDFADYVASRGGVYLPFPGAVRFAYGLEWCKSVWEALNAGIRPPASRIAEMLQLIESTKPFLPPTVAADYPDIPNPHLPQTCSQCEQPPEVQATVREIGNVQICFPCLKRLRRAGMVTEAHVYPDHQPQGVESCRADQPQT